ncbi:hypothetical protein [Pelotalea chapellei]|uniref:Uncharacterized protein n=1 Tax=Pelotalea chapellei TaxID=44671 RepID=A0ABS5U8X1_9BACT|nr:hypothetical protein [Pelotalea chapellei]MBT1072094.1 hypothetical protein [Pelotalea chapellei]
MSTTPEPSNTADVKERGISDMEHDELKRIVRLVIQEELPGIVDAVITKLEELKKVKEANYWASLSKEEYERLMGS